MAHLHRNSLRAAFLAGLAALAWALPLPHGARPVMAAFDHHYVTLEVLEGFATIAQSKGGVRRYRAGTRHRIDGSAHVEVRTRSKVRVSFTGTGGILVEGPGSFEWRTSDSDPDRIDMTLHEVRHADLEARKPGLHVALPGGWHTAFQRGAIHLRRLSGGGVQLWSHAGPPLELRWLGDPVLARPPVWIAAGTGVHLDVPRSPEPPRATSADPWPREREAWPWRQTSDTPAEAAARAELTRLTDRLGPGGGEDAPRFVLLERADGTRVRLPVVGSVEGDYSAPLAPRAGVQAQVSPVPPPARVEVVPFEEVLPAQSDGTPSAAEPDLGHVPWDLPELSEPLGRPAPLRAETPPASPSQGPGPATAGPSTEAPGDGEGSEPRREESTAEAPPEDAGSKEPPAASFVAADWRGLERVELRGVGSVAAEAAPGTELRALSAGRVRVLSTASASRPIWVFGRDADYLLSPGATIVFEADGRLRIAIGTVATHPRSSERPDWSAL